MEKAVEVKTKPGVQEAGETQQKTGLWVWPPQVSKRVDHTG